MRRITQKTGTSCGVACVAMLARLSYRDAFKLGVALWGKEYWVESHRTDISELRMMLARLGWRLGRKVRCENWHRVPPGTLAAVQWNQTKDAWHWVVTATDAEGLFVFDPRATVKQKRRRDFKKLPIAWYHHVIPS